MSIRNYPDSCRFWSNRATSARASSRVPNPKPLMTSPPEQNPFKPHETFATVGDAAGEIPVRIGYRIVELFSDGLYASPNKAIEELVSNSFDAGAANVHVLISPDRSTDDAMIIVADDGDSMDAAGLRQHWLIGESNKRSSATPNMKGRKQIGKFGIGKLATFVLANHLTHICKRSDKYFAVTMNYSEIRQMNGGIAAEQQIKLPLRELTEEQARACIPALLKGDKPGHQAIKLFGPDAVPHWTLAIMSSLKPMAREIKKGRLTWVLRTAMPLRDDFTLFLDGEELSPSKLDAKIYKHWTIGKDLTSLPEPAPDDLEETEDAAVSPKSLKRFGLTHPSLGRVTGYAELYEDLITGSKSDDIARSNGFFIYVRDRLVNIEDERFGIDPDKLRHGTFGRFRAVVHIDKLDDELRSTREAVREGPLTSVARNIVHAIFKQARSALQELDDANKPGTRSKGRIQQVPGSLTRRPLAGLLKAALSGKTSTRYLRIPNDIKDRDKYVEDFRARSEDEAGLVKDVRHESLASEGGLAVFDVAEGALIINDLHPFVAAHRDDYEQAETFPLMAMAEVLTEAYLHEAGLKPGQVQEVMRARDELLRQFARSGKRTAVLTSQMLEDAAADQAGLERELVAAFDSMGYDAVPVGGNGKPDGLATAHLGGQADGTKRRYRVSLEAKSKERDDAKISARGVAVSAVARHRDDYACEHAVVACQDFQLGQGDTPGALVTEARKDKGQTGRTITLIRLHDLARLIRLVPLRGLVLDRIKELFTTCISPEEAKAWIDKVEDEKPKKTEFKKILETIWTLQDEQPDEPIEFAALRVALRKDHQIDITKTELQQICSAIEQISPDLVKIREEKIELTQRPDKVVEAAGAALLKFPGVEAKKSIFKI